MEACELPSIYSDRDRTRSISSTRYGSGLEIGSGTYEKPHSL